MRRRILLALAIAALTLGAGGAAPTLVAKIRSPLGPCAATGAFGSVWVTAFADAKLVRIDPKRNRITARIAVGSQPCGIVAGAGSLWLNGYGTAIFRIDPTTAKVTPVEVGVESPAWLAAEDDVVWVASVSEGTAHRIDPATNSVTASVKVGSQPVDGAIAPDGTVWIPNRGSNTVSLIDGATNRVRGTIKVGPRPFVITRSFGHMWVPSWGGADIRRFRP